MDRARMRSATRSADWTAASVKGAGRERSITVEALRALRSGEADGRSEADAHCDPWCPTRRLRERGIIGRQRRQQEVRHDNHT
jgi:hypothetical protein